VRGLRRGPAPIARKLVFPLWGQSSIENPPDERRGADQNGTSRYRFRVNENINGMDAKEVDVYSGRGGADCSYHFRLGETYFVTPYEDTGTLFATVRSDTQPAADSGPLISELRARRDGKPYASLCGVLQRTQQPYSWAISGDHDHPLPGIAIELVCADHTFSTQTDSRGVYRFYGLPADT
jgi:hypothetical protein